MWIIKSYWSFTWGYKFCKINACSTKIERSTKIMNIYELKNISIHAVNLIKYFDYLSIITMNIFMPIFMPYV